MADAATGGKIRGWLKAAAAAGVGLFGGTAATYFTAVVDKVTKPTKPVANFAATVDGLTVTCTHQATGESGWWDFGDGSALEPFDAAQTTVTHTYPKPGNYAVKLTVRNFLADENERQVPVDCTTPATAKPPSLAPLTVEPIGPVAVAPAAFRIRGSIENADRVIWDLGDNKLEVTADATGPFERLVVFEKPGEYPIQLIGYSGKTAVKSAAKVNVSAPREGTLSAVLRVTDAGTRTDRREFPEAVAVKVPTPAAGKFERTLPARPGYTVADARLGKVASPAVKNVTATVTADKKSVVVKGEFTGTAGADAILPVTVTEERSWTMAMPGETVSGVFSGSANITLPLPPAPRGVANVQRKLALELRESTADGRSRVVGTADVGLPWAGTVGGRTVRLDPVGNQVKVSVASPATR